MPRKKLPTLEPLDRIHGYYGILPVEIEVWDNEADQGGRGSWKKRGKGTAINILTDAFSDRLLNPLNSPTVSDGALKRLLGRRQTSKLVQEIKPILRKHRLFFQKTALWLLAQELQKTFIVLQNAIVNNQHNLGHLPFNSPEFRIREKILKGTF